MVKTRLSGLHLDERGLEHFSHDFLKYGKEELITSLWAVGLFWQLPSKLQSVDTKRLINVVQDEVAALYLLSSDFFRNGQNPATAIQYESFADPYLTPCRNPFA